MKINDLIKRVDELIVMGEKTFQTARSSNFGSYVETSQYRLFRSASLSFLLKSFGTNHPYYSEFDKQVASDEQPIRVQAGLGVLRAVKDEMEGGWFISVKTLISAEIFSDFLEMASYLLAENYKDAAVMIGSTLEEHLRQLCQNAGIPLEIAKPSGDIIPKKADTLNADLVKQGVYSPLDQKNITAWLDLRNKAAHGKYGEYAREQVQLMYQGVLNFMSRIPS